MARKETRVITVPKARKVQLVPLDLKGLLDLKAQKVLLDLKAHKGQLVLKVQLVSLDLKALPVPLGLKETLATALQAQQGHLVDKVSKDLKVPLVNQVLKVFKVLKVITVQLVLKE